MCVYGMCASTCVCVFVCVCVGVCMIMVRAYAHACACENVKMVVSRSPSLLPTYHIQIHRMFESTAWIQI